MGRLGKSTRIYFEIQQTANLIIVLCDNLKNQIVPNANNLITCSNSKCISHLADDSIKLVITCSVTPVDKTSRQIFHTRCALIAFLEFNANAVAQIPPQIHILHTVRSPLAYVI